MGERRSFAHRVALAAVLVGTVAWVAGCGSSSVGGTGGSGTQLAGTVEAPATQVARAGMLEGALARAFTLGSPAEAAAPVSRRPVSGASVTVSLLGQDGTLGTTTTGRNGGFQLTVNAPSGSVVMVTVNARGMGERPIRLRACVQVGAGAQTSVEVNEATTVGAEAAETALEETGDAQTAEETADEVTDDQETAEEEDPAEIPDLSDTEQARENLRLRAHGHLVANFERKLLATLPTDPATQVSLRQARQAVMAAQVYARVILGLAPEIHLSRAQVMALADLIVSDAGTFTVGQVVDKLEAAGVAIPGDLLESKSEKVAAALDALQARPRLQPAIGGVTDDAVPALVALLLAEQAADPAVEFHITAQEQLNLYVNGLVGAEVPGPGQAGAAGPMGPGMAGR